MSERDPTEAAEWRYAQLQYEQLTASEKLQYLTLYTRFVKELMNSILNLAMAITIALIVGFTFDVVSGALTFIITYLLAGTLSKPYWEANHQLERFERAQKFFNRKKLYRELLGLDKATQQVFKQQNKR